MGRGAALVRNRGERGEIMHTAGGGEATQGRGGRREGKGRRAYMGQDVWCK